MEKEYRLAYKRVVKTYGAEFFRSLWNLRVENGEICGGVGAYALLNDGLHEIEQDTKASTVREAFRAVNFENGDEGALGFLTETGDAYLLSAQSGRFEKLRAFGGNTKHVRAVARVDGEARYYSVFVGEGGLCVYSTTEGWKQVSEESFLPFGCFCGGRVFFVKDGRTLQYTAPFAPDSVQSALYGGGRLTIGDEDGALVALRTLYGKVYAFFERGIERIDAGGDGRDMRVERVPYGGGKIFGGSISEVVGGKAFFAATDGVYATDGKKTWRVAKNTEWTANENYPCAHAAFDGTYVVGYSDTRGASKTLVVDASTEEGFFGPPMQNLCACQGVGYCVANGYWKRLRAHAATNDFWNGSAESAWTDFGMEGRKRVAELRVFGTGKCFVGVQSDEGAHGEELTLSERGTLLRAAPRGKRFCITLQTINGCRVRGFSVALQALQGAWK